MDAGLEGERRPAAEAQTRWSDDAQAPGWDGDRLARTITGRSQPERTQPAVDDILDTVTAKSSTEGHLDRIADAWAHLDADGKTVAVTAETNAHVDALNRAIQDTAVARKAEVKRTGIERVLSYTCLLIDT